MIKFFEKELRQRMWIYKDGSNWYSIENLEKRLSKKPAKAGIFRYNKIKGDIYAEERKIRKKYFGNGKSVTSCTIGSFAEKMDCVVDFTHIYNFVEDLYCADNRYLSMAPLPYSRFFIIKVISLFVLL